MSRLAKRRYAFGDPLPMPGQWCIVSGANGDITSDRDRSYTRRLVIGYTPCGGFVCLQSEGCWPTVERLTNCWFALPGAPS
jgi:hypothetical protein